MLDISYLSYTGSTYCLLLINWVLGKSREMDFPSYQNVLCFYSCSTLEIPDCPLPARLFCSFSFLLKVQPSASTMCLNSVPWSWRRTLCSSCLILLLSVGRNSTRYSILQFQTSIMYSSDRCWPFCSCGNETYVGNALKRILMGSHPLLTWQGFKESFLWDEAIYSPWITKLKLLLTSLPFLIIGRLSILCSLGGFCFLDS